MLYGPTTPWSSQTKSKKSRHAGILKREIIILDNETLLVSVLRINQSRAHTEYLSREWPRWRPENFEIQETRRSREALKGTYYILYCTFPSYSHKTSNYQRGRRIWLNSQCLELQSYSRTSPGWPELFDIQYVEFSSLCTKYRPQAQDCYNSILESSVVWYSVPYWAHQLSKSIIDSAGTQAAVAESRWKLSGTWEYAFLSKMAKRTVLAYDRAIRYPPLGLLNGIWWQNQFDCNLKLVPMLILCYCTVHTPQYSSKSKSFLFPPLPLPKATPPLHDSP